jgi:hypothetical protein
LHPLQAQLLSAHRLELRLPALALLAPVEAEAVLVPLFYHIRQTLV